MYNIAGLPVPGALRLLNWDTGNELECDLAEFNRLWLAGKVYVPEGVVYDRSKPFETIGALSKLYDSYMSVVVRCIRENSHNHFLYEFSDNVLLCDTWCRNVFMVNKNLLKEFMSGCSDYNIENFTLEGDNFVGKNYVDDVPFLSKNVLINQLVPIIKGKKLLFCISTQSYPREFDCRGVVESIADEQAESNDTKDCVYCSNLTLIVDDTVEVPNIVNVLTGFKTLTINATNCSQKVVEEWNKAIERQSQFFEHRVIHLFS